MKKQINKIVLLLLLVIVISSCEDNEDFASIIQTENQFPIPDAEFTINETDYSISNGYITSPDDGSNGNNYKLSY